MRTISFIILILVSPIALADEIQVRLETSLGGIIISLNAEKAPGTVKNFLEYVRSGYYDGTIFHRVIPGFMIQGGGYNKDFKEGPTRDPINNEADNGLQNVLGSIAMARTSRPHSATAQFFINVADNRFLNHTSKSVRGWGYAVFGEVIEGMDIVNRIAKLPTGRGGPFVKDVPQESALIIQASIIRE